MDITAWDEDGILDVNDIDNTLDEPNPQDVFDGIPGTLDGPGAVNVVDGHTVTLVSVGPDQKDPAPSPFENLVGSQFDDLLFIDPLERIRYVDANDGRDFLDFGGGGSEVTDTSRSLTAAGQGTVVYDGVEWVEHSTAGARILDNDDYGYRQTGFWNRSRTVGYLNDMRSADTGVGDRVASWTAEGVSPGWYRVSVTYLPGPAWASNAQFRVLDGDTPATAMLGDGSASSGIAPINQTGVPSSFIADGANWLDLTDANNPEQALYFFISGHEMTVELPNLGNDGFAVADAVRLERLNGVDMQADLGFTDPLPPFPIARESEIRIVSRPDGRSLVDGFGVENFGSTDTDRSVVRTYWVQNTGLADLTVSVLDAAPYLVPDGFAATLDMNTIVPGGTATLTVTLASSTAGVFGGKLFLETNDRDENPFEFTVTGAVGAAEPELSENAVVADNDTENFQVTEGRFNFIRRDTRFVDNDVHTARGGNNTARWTLEFEPVGAPRTVDIAATWAAGENRATNAPFMVFDAANNPLWSEPVRVDQNLAPDDFQDDGVWWEFLGVVELGAGETQLFVELSTATANNHVIADAVWGGPSSTPNIIVMDGDDRLENGHSLIDLGFVELNTTDTVLRTFTVMNSGGVPLNVQLPISMPAGFSLVGTSDDLDLLDGLWWAPPTIWICSTVCWTGRSRSFRAAALTWTCGCTPWRPAT